MLAHGDTCFYFRICAYMGARQLIMSELKYGCKVIVPLIAWKILQCRRSDVLLPWQGLQLHSRRINFNLELVRIECFERVNLTISKGEPKTTKQFPERNITPQTNLEK